MSSWPPMARRGPAISEDAVSALEAQLATSFPDDYRDFLLHVNGGRTERSHRVFRMKNDRTNLNSLYSLRATPPGSDLQAEWEDARARLPAEVIPVGYDDGG